MKITEVLIQNLRGFIDEKIIFPHTNLAVLIGENGAGKSSVLDFISYFFSSCINELISDLSGQPLLLTHFFKPEDMGKNTNQAASCEVSFESGGHTRYWRTKDLHNLLSNTQAFSSSKANVDLARLLAQRPDSSIPILAYYSTNRRFAPKQDTPPSEEYRYQQLSAYVDSDHWQGDFSEFATWFRLAEDLENQHKIQQADLEYQSKELATIRNALTLFFGKLKFTIANLRVERGAMGGNGFKKPKIQDNKLVADKQGETLGLQQLSSGEQVILLLVADIARRLAVANPSLSAQDVLSQGEGIVLIDEIELHLHPKWQRNIIPALRLTFPSLQLIVTTHSPQVLSSLERESVLLLDNFKVKPYTPPTQGRDSNSILYDLFGVEERPPDDARELELLYRHIREENMAEAHALFKALTQKWGSDDAEIKRAQMYLEDISKQLFG